MNPADITTPIADHQAVLDEFIRQALLSVPLMLVAIAAVGIFVRWRGEYLSGFELVLAWLLGTLLFSNSARFLLDAYYFLNNAKGLDAEKQATLIYSYRLSTWVIYVLAVSVGFWLLRHWARSRTSD